MAVAHQKDVATVAGGVTSVVFQAALGADPVAVSTWFFGAIDGLMARIQAGYALNRRSTMDYLSRHGALNGARVSPVPGSLDIGALRSRLEITGPVAFKTSIGAGRDTQTALRSMATQMSGVADESVRNGDRDVITRTIRHGSGVLAYRRRLAGHSCGFCAMLASRGAVYGADSGNFRAHGHCRCWLEPVYRRQIEPPEVQRLQRQWQRITAGQTGKDKARAWRRHWESGRVDQAALQGPIGRAVSAGVPGAGPAPLAPEVRAVLLRPNTVRGLEQTWRSEMRAITGRDIAVAIPDGTSILTAREYAEGVLRGLERFPDADLVRIEFAAGLPANEYAHAEAGVIRFNARLANEANRPLVLSSLRGDVAKWEDGVGWSTRGDGTTVSTAIHEFGHILDDTVLGRVHSEALLRMDTLARQAGLDTGPWLEREISAYSASDAHEMVAEAFADVMLRGDAASIASKRVFEVLEREYKAGGFRAGTTPRIGRAVSEPAEIRNPWGWTQAELREFQSIGAEVRGQAAARLDDQAKVLGRNPPTGVTRGDRALDVPPVKLADLTRAGDPRADALWEGIGVNGGFINRAEYLRNGLLGGDPVADRIIAQIDSLMAESELGRPILVYRGIGGSRLPADAVGHTFTDLSFTSASADPRVAVGFGGTQLRIVVPKGTRALRLADRTGPNVDPSEVAQSEILLDRGLTFRVVRDRQVSEGQRILDVEIVPSPVRRAPTAELPLTRQTAAQLRALAKERGVTIPAGAKKADIVRLLEAPPKTAVEKAAEAARAAQAVAADARTTAEALADVLSMVGNQASTRALAHRAASLLKPEGPLTEAARKAIAPLAKALQSGDTAAIERAAKALERKFKLTRVDAGKTPTMLEGREVVSLDRTLHEVISGQSVGAGERVWLVRPGYQATIDGRTVTLVKAQVQAIPADVIREAERKALREAARVKAAQIETATGTARLLAEIDQLIAQKADIAVIRQRLSAKLIEREQLFAGADPAIREALAAAAESGDTAALRLAVTRAGTKAKIKPISKAGTKTKFDADTMEPVGGEIKAGTPVTVVTRGSSVTLPDGTVVQIAKAKVTPVVKAAPKVAGRPAAKAVDMADIFDASDAKIEAALRDVYEGKFGPYTTKVRVIITRAGTRTSRTGRVTKVQPSISVDGKIYDAKGHEVGYFGRSIGPVDLSYGDVTRREVWAEHSIVQLDPSAQGKGFGAAFNQRAIDWYRRSGVHGISLNDHNGYVWASQGFSWGPRGMASSTVDDMGDLITAIRAGRTKDKYGVAIPKALREARDLDAQLALADNILARLRRLKPTDPDYPTAYEVSQLGRTTQKGKTSTWFGKYFMFNNGSTNELILNPDQGVVISP